MHNTGITISPRTKSNAYNVRLNQTTFDILSSIFEFKLLIIPQLVRLVTPKRNTAYLYRKLHQMWSAGLVEAYKVQASTSFGTPIYYGLGKRGLALLEQHGKYSPVEIAKYPQTKSLLRLDTFAHDIQVAELASMEMLNATPEFNIALKGETSSLAYDWMSDSNVEVFTPDYTAIYAKEDHRTTVYTEFERTPKSKEALFRKIKRYLLHLEHGERKNIVIRFIFQTPSMERNFWLTMILDSPSLLRSLPLVTTNLTCIADHAGLLAPIYATHESVQLVRRGKVDVDLSRRVKLLPWI